MARAARAASREVATGAWCCDRLQATKRVNAQSRDTQEIMVYLTSVNFVRGCL